MSLITQKKPNLSGGVNQQDAIHRHSTQVEEMINCVPTLDAGTRLRNPTAPIPVYDLNSVLSEVTFPINGTSAFIYEHDRGSLGDRDSELAFIITQNGGLEIIDLTLKQELDADGQEVLAGTIYKDGAGINFPEGDDGIAARAYLSQFFGRNGFAMTTVKDTTFVANKFISPKMTPLELDALDPIVSFGNVLINGDGTTSGLNQETVTGGIFTVPEKINSIFRKVYGSGGGAGGGQGGESNGSREGNGGLGGKSGGESKADILVEQGETYVVNAGIGGAGGVGSNTGGSPSYGGDGTSGEGSVFGTDGQEHYVSISGGAFGDGGGSPSYPSHDGYIGEASTIGAAGAGGRGAAGGNGGLAAGAGGGAGGDNDNVGDGQVGFSGGKGGDGLIDLSWSLTEAESTDYLRSGYVWIKSASVVTQGYAYGCTIKLADQDGLPLQSIYVPETIPDLEGTVKGAELLAVNITASLAGRGVVTQIGSMIQVTMNKPDIDGNYEQITTIEASDTFGNLASFAWGHNVESLSDLPKSMGDFLPVVQVGENKKATYWLRYTGGIWTEYRKPNIYIEMDSYTMPHTITRKRNQETGSFEFYVEQYKWDRRRIGDDESNKLPSFITEWNSLDSYYIKDIFFFRNRLGFITKDSIITSEVGEYGNFFRTSTAALLDGDRIDTNVESLNSVNLEFAVLLEDSVMLFADKAQFRFSGGDILSPASYKIQQELAYDVNTSVRPLFMNDKVFFVADRGSHSAVYEMTISNGSNQDSTATDLTAHCQTYVDGLIERLTGSAVNNMLFLTSLRKYNDSDGTITMNTVFVYKYHEEGRQKQQSAWNKWTFDGDIIAGFAISKNFYLMIDRTDAITEADWILSTGQWRMNQPWKMDGRWIMSPDSLKTFKQFERLAIQPKDEAGMFLDNYVTRIDGYINLGEWVYGKDGDKDTRGTVQMKTIEVAVSPTSTLKLLVSDRQRNTIREIPNKQCNGRKPMVYGDSKNVRIAIRNDGDRGFRIEMVSFEGRVNKRAKAH